MPVNVECTKTWSSRSTEEKAALANDDEHYTMLDSLPCKTFVVNSAVGLEFLQCQVCMQLHRDLKAFVKHERFCKPRAISGSVLEVAKRELVVVDSAAVAARVDTKEFKPCPPDEYYHPRLPVGSLRRAPRTREGMTDDAEEFLTEYFDNAVADGGKVRFNSEEIVAQMEKLKLSDGSSAFDEDDIPSVQRVKTFMTARLQKRAKAIEEATVDARARELLELVNVGKEAGCQLASVAASGRQTSSR